MRPVILSRPEKLAFLLTIFCAGGSVTTSSPGCRVAGVCGTPLGWRCPGGNPGSGLAPGGATATPCRAAAAPPRRPAARSAERRWCRAAAPAAATAPSPAAARPAPAADDWASAAAGPRGSSGTSSSSSGGGCGCRAECCRAAAARGSEKILPICARAGGASEIVVAATRAAKPVRTMVRNISRGFNRRIGLATLYRFYTAARRPSG